MTKAKYWVNMKTYRWAQTRWKRHDVRIDPNLDDNELVITRTGFILNPRRRRKIIICPAVILAEEAKWNLKYNQNPPYARRFDR